MNTRPDSITIGRRFRGPPNSGNGGYTAGRLAAAHPAGEHGAVAVTLRKPPPLDVALAVEHVGESTVLRDEEAVVAEASGSRLVHGPVAPVSVSRAREIEPAYAGLVEHPFPTCFTCGPERDPADGLRLLPGRLPDGRTACTWTPHKSLAAGELSASSVPPAYIWAALDCPGAWTGDLTAGRPLVLGRIAARVDGVVEVGERYVVVGQLLGHDGRKTRTATALYDDAERLVARAEHVWIEVDPETFAV